MNPTISVVNRSRTVSDADIKRNLRALQKQITRDFEPAWGWGANLRFDARKFDMKMVIGDHAKSGDLGFHIEGGKPVGYIYAKDDLDAEGEYTSTLSHELLEMIADPNVNLYAAGPFRFKGRRGVGFFALEVCDPVQENYYKIDGVRVQATPGRSPPSAAGRPTTCRPDARDWASAQGTDRTCGRTEGVDLSDPFSRIPQSGNEGLKLVVLSRLSPRCPSFASCAGKA